MATPTALLSSMTQASELLESLSALLIAERTALRDRDTLNIQTLLEQKTELLGKLQANASARSQLLQDSGFAGDEAGMDTYLESLSITAATKLSQQWQTLKDALNSIKMANQVNGTIVHRSKAQVESLLNILRGQSGEQKIYTDAGKASAVGGGHTLGKA